MAVYLKNVGYLEEYEKDMDRLLRLEFFENKKDVLILSAVIAFKEVSRNSIDNYKLKKIKVLSNVKFDEYEAIIYAIAIAHKNDALVVINEREVIEIFNKYANIGLSKFRDIILNSNGDSLSNLESLISNPSGFISDVGKFKKYI